MNFWYKVTLLIILTPMFIYLVYLYADSKFKYMENEKQKPVNNIVFETPETTISNEYSAWIAWWNDENAEDLAIESLTKNKSKLKAILPMWYKINTNGEILPIEAAKRRAEIEELATVNKVDIIATITNDFDPDSVSNLLDNEDLQNEVIDNLIFIAISKGYKGWDLDWEELYEGDRTGLNDFVKIFGEKLHEKNLVLSLTLQAKTGTKIDSKSSNAQDWVELSKYADQIRIMAYDFHHSTSEAGAITPIDDYRKVLDLAIKTIPLDKINIGLPFYGYDWIGNAGKSIQYNSAIELSKKQNIVAERDAASQELTFKYKDGKIKHEVWFEDAQSANVKIGIANSKGISKFTFWRLGGEDQSFWNE